MTRVAAIDIGTNSTRLLVADRDGTGRDSKLFALDRRTQITRLGQGVDKQRTLHPDAIERTLATLREYKAIIDGLKESIDHLKAATGESGADSVLPLILLTQYFDTLKELGLHASNNTIMLPHGPGALQDIWTQMAGALVASGKANGATAGQRPSASSGGAKPPAVPPRPGQ